MVAIVHLNLDMAEAGAGRRTFDLMQVIRQLGAWHLIDGNLADLRHLALNHLAGVVDNSSHLRRLEVLELRRGHWQMRSAKMSVHLVV